MLDFEKSLFIVLLLLIILTSICLADSNDLNLRNIKELALKQNNDLKIADIEKENAAIDFEKNMLGNLETNSKSVRLQGELNLLMAENNYIQTKNSIIIDIIEQYLNILKLEKEIKSIQKEVELEKRRVQEVEVEMEMGYKSSLDLFEQERKYQDIQNRLERKQDSKGQQLKELKFQLGLDSTDRITFIKLEIPDIWEVQEGLVIKTVLENSKTIKIKNKQLEIAEARLVRAEALNESEMELKKLKNKVAIARLDYLNEKQNQESSAQNQYFLYKQAIKSLDMAERSLIQAKENYKIIKTQMQEGMASSNDLLSEEVVLMKAKNSFRSVIIDYYIQKLSLQNIMGQELEVELVND